MAAGGCNCLQIASVRQLSKNFAGSITLGLALFALLTMLADLLQAPDAQERRPYGETLRGLRGGVQDVAVKRLMCSTDGKLQKFVEVWLSISGP